jgi:hypothetical protein
MKNINNYYSLKFREVNNRYTPIVNGCINEFIEFEYYTKGTYSITWINKYEESKTNYVDGFNLHEFILMIHNKYFQILTNKTNEYEN